MMFYIVDMKEAAKKFYSLDLDADVQAFFNEETGEVEVFEFRQVVLEITDDKGQILLEDAIKQDPEVLEGDDLEELVEHIIEDEFVSKLCFVKVTGV